MNTFKRKALFTAVLAGLGAAGTAEAVYLNPNNTGHVLVYPYYTVQRVNNNAFNTYLSVVNTTSRAKAVKVRVLEGKTSAEVLDFNLFLSPNDMWTAVIESSDGTDTSAARMFTRDLSCTNPVGELRGAGEPFRNFVLIENAAGVGLPGTGVERTREGYVEIIEMGTLTGAWATAVTHTASGAPANCAVVQNDLAPSSIEAPTGGLVGTGTLINVNNGQDMTYKADALEAWRETPFYSPPAFLSPSLQDADPPISLVVNAGGVNPITGASTELTAYRTAFDPAVGGGVSAGARAVASVFMHASVINEYILDANTGSNTDWVITQPLKTPYFVTNATARPPYSNLLTSSGACEAISFTFFNREERSATAQGSSFSPPAPGQALDTLCWESTVLSVRNPVLAHTNANATNISNVLGSRNTRTVNVTGSDAFQNGWARLTFTGTNAVTTGMGGVAAVFDASTGSLDAPVLTAGVAVTFFGLPVTGFAVRNFANGSLTCSTGICQGNYGGLFQHSYVNRITP
jgi:hypothetical protein